MASGEFVPGVYHQTRPGVVTNKVSAFSADAWTKTPWREAGENISELLAKRLSRVYPGCIVITCLVSQSFERGRRNETNLDCSDRAGCNASVGKSGGVAGTAHAAGGPRLPEGVKVLRDLPYVEAGHERNRLDLYLPEKAKGRLPLIVWIHGGAWWAGNKKNCPAVPFATKGYAVASINYRLSQHAVFPAGSKTARRRSAG